MPKLTDAELTSLKSRFQKATLKGYGIALSSKYIALLNAVAGQDVVPPGVQKGSASHLLQLTKKAVLVRSGKATPEPKPKVEAKPKVEPKPEPKPEPKVEPKVEAKVEAKVEPKPEPKPEPKVEAKVEAKPEPAPKEEPVDVPEAAELERMTKTDLYEQAQKVDLEGRSEMTKRELLGALKSIKR